MLLKDLKKRKFKWKEVQQISENIALEMLLVCYNLFIDKEIKYEEVVLACIQELKEIRKGEND